MELTQEQVMDAADRYSDVVDGYDKEIEQLQQLPQAFEEGTWEWSDLEYIVEWKSGRFGGTNVETFNENPEREVEITIAEVVESNAVIRKVKDLSGLDGVKERTASAILLFMNPSAYTVLDVNAWETLQDSGYLYDDIPDDPDPDDYLRYLGVCHALSNEINVELRTLDRALWVVGRQDL